MNFIKTLKKSKGQVLYHKKMDKIKLKVSGYVVMNTDNGKIDRNESFLSYSYHLKYHNYGARSFIEANSTDSFKLHLGEELRDMLSSSDFEYGESISDVCFRNI